MRKLILTFLLALLLAAGADSQNGSPHGILTTWIPPSPVGGSGVIQGYNLFRCVGSCTLTSTGWVSVTGLIPATQTSFLDPAAGLNVNTTYSYAVGTVDSNGNQSGWDIATVSVGASFPQNPNAV